MIPDRGNLESVRIIGGRGQSPGTDLAGGWASGGIVIPSEDTGPVPAACPWINIADQTAAGFDTLIVYDPAVTRVCPTIGACGWSDVPISGTILDLGIGQWEMDWYGSGADAGNYAKTTGGLPTGVYTLIAVLGGTPPDTLFVHI